jgi:hypothetical protein
MDLFFALSGEHIFLGSKKTAIPVTGRGGPCSCETSGLPHFVDNRLTGGGPAALCPQEDPCYSFQLNVESTPGSY